MILLIRRPPSAYHHAGGGGRSIDTGCKDSCSSDPAWLLLAAAELVKENKRSLIRALLGQETKEYLF